MNDGKICVSVCAKTAVEMIERIRSAEEFADLVEVRFDSLRNDELSRFRSQIADLKFAKPILATFRSQEQGGNRHLTLTERLKFWEALLNEPPPNLMIDIEAESAIAMAVTTRNVPRIVSHHDFDGVPDNVGGIFAGISEAFDAKIVKIAITANDITEAISVWNLIEKARQARLEIIPIAMGDAGKWTRILGLAHGAFLTYASLDAGGETAPGQVNAEELIGLYRVKQLDRDTKVHGILGDPVSQSLSTFMHNPAFASVGFNGVFIPFLVKNIHEFMRRMVRPETREVELNFGGFSVTMPHKQSIMQHLDTIDPTAAEIGAVNTVKVGDDGKLTGYNTDAHGFITPLKAKYGDLRGARAAVFGAGGAARACVHALKKEGAEVELFVRDVAKARAFADEFEIPIGLISNFEPSVSIDMLVDSTPLGMSGPHEQETLFIADQLKGVKFVYDLVTKPYDTPIIREAKKAGIPAIGGLEMLVAQGAKQFEIWTGKPAPVEQMRDLVLGRFAELNK